MSLYAWNALEDDQIIFVADTWSGNREEFWQIHCGFGRVDD